MNDIHLVLTGKGGVGKSLVASILAQYLLQRHDQVLAFDTDPVNDTFSRYRRLQAQRVNILGRDNRIDARAFDQLMEQLLQKDLSAVVDNGASTFVPLMAYLVENRALDLLAAAGRRVLIHSVLTGGQAQADTLHGLKLMLTQQGAPMVVWLNEYFGEVEPDGQPFEASALYQAHRERIVGRIALDRGNPDTFGRDMELMIRSKLTFAEVLDSSEFGIMPKQRLKMMRDAVFQQIAACGL